LFLRIALAIHGAVSTFARLRRSVLFAGLDEPEATALAQIITTTNVPKGGTLFIEGDSATGFFVLLSGAVRVYKSSPDGREYTLHRINPGQMFAEAAIFDGSTYPASCMALEDSDVAHVPKDGFLALVADSPQIALKIIGGLSGLLRDFTAQLEALSLKDVLARLAEYITRQAEISGAAKFDLPSSKAELAAELGTISETLSRSLRKLRESGAIEIDGRRIRVLDAKRLKLIEDGDKV
jgi:CRP/FNR family transcriptional regulator